MRQRAPSTPSAATWAASALVGFVLLLVVVSGSASATHGTPPSCSITTSGATGSNGWFRGSVTVTLAITPSNADGTIQYRLDGGSLQTYSGAFVVASDGMHSVTCRVTDHDGVSAETAPLAINIDQTDPTSCGTSRILDAYSLAQITGTSGWYSPVFASTGVRDELAAFDATSGADVPNMTVAVDGSAVPVSAGPYVTVQGEGAHSVTCIVSDFAGNQASFTHTVGIDTSAPDCVGSYSGSLGSAGWYVTHGQLSLAASDPLSGVASVNYTLDGAGVVPYTNPVAVGDGAHSIRCGVTDKAGNTFERVMILNVDALAPTSCFAQSAYDPLRGRDVPLVNGWFAPSSPTLYGLRVYPGADDAGSGAQSFTLVVDGEALGGDIPNGSSFTLYGEGTRVVSCTVTDRAGHEATYGFTVKLDGTRPTCRGSYSGTAGSGGWYRSGEFRFDATDEGSGIAYLNTTGALVTSLAGGEGVVNLTRDITTEGLHTVTCAAIDNAGNLAPSATFSVRLDFTPPACSATVTGPLGGDGWRTGSAVIALAATDNASGVATTTYAVGNDPYRAYSSPLRLGDDGEHVVSCRVTDRAGNVGLEPTLVKIDQTPPKLCESTARDATGNRIVAVREWYSSRLQFELSTTDKHSGLADVEILLDGAPIPGIDVSDTTATVRLPIDQRGKHTITCSATDNAGNAAGPSTLPVNIDDTLPQCNGDAQGDAQNGWHRRGASLALDATDSGSGIDAFQYSLDGSAARTYDGPIAIEGDGNHRVECIVRDLAGNTATKTFDLRLDATDPWCALVGIDATRVLDAPLRVRIEPMDNTSGVASALVSVNGDTPQPGRIEVDLATAGVHEITCTITDEAGNAREVLLDRLRVGGADADVQAAAVPLADDARARTREPIPAGGALLAVAAAGAALALRRK